ncbi:type II toxin-antitoxin system RelE/ParE family toxin [Flavobacterium sp.]|jgi:plasmid stabilization system protein ParE|uniref:type II toxin-antitoxin system RelE/ParE family toxin n=1 Tax=Flavobacterium sp. TaxID=239 RepID=UPI0037BEAE48
MAIEVYWSQLAETKIEDIFFYYKLKAGTKIAKKIIIGIIDATIDLDKNPEIGQIEELLKDRPQEFRYLIYTNYKIIYWYNKDKNRIVIANVFDTRQNPQKLQETF